jgi:predicted adenylyl cyclase CyaB
VTKKPKPIFLHILAWFFHKLAHTDSAVNPLEVERKFSISGDEEERIISALTSLSFVLTHKENMTDIFLPSPREGEMMRVRQIVPDTKARAHKRIFITSKKWVRTNNGSKERQEAESEISPWLGALLVVAGRFINNAPLLNYTKERLIYSGTYHGFACVASIDNTSGLGKYSGHYLEVEILVPANIDTSEAQKTVFALSQTLLNGERPYIEMSYKDMLTAHSKTN